VVIGCRGGECREQPMAGGGGEPVVVEPAVAPERGGGSLDQIIFGRNEPALHHYHQTYASKLGEAAIPLLGAI
jgi:hypothetical protein